jgi:hypothetical protein
MIPKTFYICALDPKSERLYDALSCPDELTAEGVYRFACRALKEYDFLTRPHRHSVNRLMFCLVSVARSGRISIPPEKDWFWWCRGYWRGWYESKDLYGKARTDLIFDREEFERADSITREVLRMKESIGAQYLEPGMFVMRKVYLAQQPAAKIKPMESVKLSVDCSPLFFGAANGNGMLKTAIEVAYAESIELANEPANVVVNNPKDISDPVVEILKEQNEILKERLPLPIQSATLSTTPISNVADSESAGKTKPKSRAKRTCDSDLRKAAKLVYDENKTQFESEKIVGIPQGSLSKGKGEEIMLEYQKILGGKPTKIEKGKARDRRQIEDDFIYNELH